MCLYRSYVCATAGIIRYTDAVLCMGGSNGKFGRIEKCKDDANFGLL